MPKIKSEAFRYYENARELLSKSPIEDNIYVDIKYVQEACGTAYLAILKAIDEYLVRHGVEEKRLPQSVDDYRGVLKKYLSIRNGKLSKEFESLYRGLHIAGYYRGLLDDVNAVKDYFKSAKTFIEKLR